MKFIRLAAAMSAVSMLALCSTSFAFPTKPLRLVLGNPPGGPTDIAARIYAERLSTRLNQPVVVENRPGANNMVALNAVAQAEPDGHTLAYMSSGITALPVLSKSFTFDVSRNFSAVSLLVSGPLALYGAPAAPFKTVDELVANLKANPGKLNYANISSGDWLPAELFKFVTGTRFELIRYNGGAPAYQAIAANDAQFTITALAAAKPLADAGKLRLLAVNGTKRIDSVNVPALFESSIPALRELAKFSGFNSFWFGVLAPGKTPRAAIDTLYAASSAVAKDAAFAKRMRELNFDVVNTTPEEFASVMRTEADKWKEVAKQAGIQPQ